MKAIKSILAIFIACALFLSACKKDSNSIDQNQNINPTPKVFDNTIKGLWLVTKLIGKAPVIVNDSFFIRKDKYNSGESSSGKSIKVSIDAGGSQFTMYDYLGTPTTWNINKVTTSEFEVMGITTGNTGTFYLKKIQDAPDCPTLTNITGSGTNFEAVGDLLFISGGSFYSNKYFEYSYGSLFFPGMPPPNNNTLVEGDTLSYQPYISSCPKILYLFKSNKWVKQ